MITEDLNYLVIKINLCTECLSRQTSEIIVMSNEAAKLFANKI